MPMCEIVVDNRVQVTENTQEIVYEKKYAGTIKSNGTFHLLRCVGKRTPLTSKVAVAMTENQKKAA